MSLYNVPKNRSQHTSAWLCLARLIPSLTITTIKTKTTGGWTARIGGINSLSHHLVAQPEKLFSLVLLLLEAPAKLLLYLQPLEYGKPGFI